MSDPITQQVIARARAKVTPLPALGQSVPAPNNPLAQAEMAPIGLGTRLENYSIGLGQGLADQGEGLYQMVTNPVQTARSLYELGKYAVTQPGEAAAQFGNYVKEGVTGGPLSLGQFIGENLGFGGRSRQPVMMAREAAPQINIGMNVGDRLGLDPVEVRQKLREQGVTILNEDIVPSNTERTLVATLDRPLSATEGTALSAALDQDAIAQKIGKSGDLFGPKASEWGPFNPAYFMSLPKYGTKGRANFVAARMAQLPEPVLRKIESQPELRPVYERVVPYLTQEEIGRLRPQGAGALQKLVNDYDAGQITQLDELASMAKLGAAKRGWYQNSAEALLNVFGRDDSPRFVAVLAALSPQNSVGANLELALKTWKLWVAGGRQTDDASLNRLFVQALGGESAEKMSAWTNNLRRSLQSENPRDLQLSGPKVNSFAMNLRGYVNEVTNDTWQAEALGVSQSLFSGKTLKGADPEGVTGKGIGYLFTNALTRQTAERLSKQTGTTWTPAEVQETVWSYVRTVITKAGKKGTVKDAMQAVTDADIMDVEDFSTLLPQGIYGQLLREAGYGDRLGGLAGRTPEAPPAFTVGARATDAVARRLEQTLARRRAEGD